MDRVGWIVLGVKEQSYARRVTRKQRKIESSLGFDPGCAEGPRVSSTCSNSSTARKESIVFLGTNRRLKFGPAYTATRRCIFT